MAVNYANRGYDQKRGPFGPGGYSPGGNPRGLPGWYDAVEMGKVADHERAMELAKLQSGGGSSDFFDAFMSKNYIDKGQHKRATGRYSGALADIDAARGISTGLAQTGGISDDEFGSLMGKFGVDRARYQNVADNGILSGGEFDQIVNSGYQSVMDQAGMAAANTFNANNLSGNPFAGAAIMAQGIGLAGKNRSDVLSNTMKYQADSKMAGMAGSKGLLDSETGALMGRADNRLTGAGQLNDLANTGRGIADSLAELDTSTMPGYMKAIWRDQQRNKRSSNGGGNTAGKV